MINAVALLRDLKRLTTTIEADIRERLATTPELDASLDSEWQAAKDAARTGATLHDFKEEAVTQAAVHWLLMGVFIRFLEDNALIDRPYLTASDPASRALAQDRHETYFRQHPGDSDREYLLAAFHEAGALPAMGALFDERHNPLFRLAVSGDGAMTILGFWQKIDPDTGALIHDFTDPNWNTRFLGDLYQDLSEAAQKKFALLQTPEFVEEFILDRTLTPAIHEFGYREVRLIDPTCGSGHFLLGGLARLLDHWQRNDPGRNARDVVQRALDGIYGVDLNPFAIAISRFRLLVASLKACGENHLAEAPNFKFNLAAGDSLLHGPRLGRGQLELGGEAENLAGRGLAHAYASEDLANLNRILGQRYHAVVGNPPYITVKDATLNAAYRARYTTCHMKYSLGVPFTERFFELAIPGGEREPAGYVGLITANSFMKREFGKKLIEDFLPRVDLSHVIDTSGAYIPGHGTPTVILFGRDRTPVISSVRTVMGIKGEPSTPVEPARGLVWRAIVEQVDVTGSESEFVSIADTPRTTFARHPWSIGGGGVSDLKEMIEGAASNCLESVIHEMGFGCVISEEEAFWDCNPIRLAGAESLVRPIVAGDEVRDWQLADGGRVLFPYDETIALLPQDRILKALWWARTVLGARRDFGNRSYREVGRPWWEYHQIPAERNRTPLAITFGEVATHNHFVLDRGGKVFNRTAPIIKLPAGASEDDYLRLVGLLNSSVACFWMKQVSHQKQMMGGDGIRISEKAKVPYQFSGTQLKRLPLPELWNDEGSISRLIDLSRKIDQLAHEIAGKGASEAIHIGLSEQRSILGAWNEITQVRRQKRSLMIRIQEELDFLCYRMYGLIDTDEILGDDFGVLLCMEAGDRPFCIRSQYNQEGFNVPPTIPEDWPKKIRNLWDKRLEEIEKSPALKIIEDPHYKRRWIGRQGLFNHTGRSDELLGALKLWLLDRLEARFKANAGMPALTTTSKLADILRTDSDFMQVADLYAGRSDFDVSTLVAELAGGEAIPLLPVLRYKESGLRKRAAWEQTWALQRREDAGESVGDIPLPPKYKSTDFQKADYWRLRGGLDVPKERFVSLPHCSRDADGSLLIAWAGLNPLQLGTAIATHYLDMKDNEGWGAERLKPLLASIAELAPWIKQWHNEPDAEHGTRMGDYLDGFVDEEARNLGLTREAVVAWQPPATTARRGRRPS